MTANAEHTSAICVANSTEVIFDPRDTDEDTDEDSGRPLQAAKVLDSPPEPQNEAIERDEFEKSNEKYAKFKMYEYVSSVRSMSMAQKSSIVLARMFRSV